MQDAALHAALRRFLAAKPYYPCCLLVHPNTAHLDRVCHELAASLSWPLVSLDAILSERLLDVRSDRRGVEAREVLLQAIMPYTPGPLICTDSDVLFEPQLDLDPLALLQEASRHTTLVTAWVGTFAGDVLSYAVPEHSHYRVWRHPDLCSDCVVAV